MKIKGISKALEMYTRIYEDEYDMTISVFDMYKLVKQEYIQNKEYENHPDFCGYIEWEAEMIAMGF